MLAVLTALRRRLGLLRRGPAKGGKRILVIACEEQLGSIMVLTPCFALIRRLAPDAELTVICTSGAGDLLKSDPAIDRVVAVPSGYPRLPELFIHAWRAGLFGREQQPEQVITTLGSRRRAPALLALAFPGARVTGFAAGGMRRLFDLPLDYDPRLSMIENNLRIAELFGAGARAVEPVIHIRPDVRRRVAHLLNLPDDNPVPIAVMAVETSGGQPTDWYPDRLAAVADHLHGRHGARVVFVGTGAGASVIDRVRALMVAPSLSLAGRTSIPELAALFDRAAVAVALDTGAMHVARATRVPLVVIASAWQEPHHWLPLRRDRCLVLSRHSLPCALCLKAHCATRECLDEISVADVTAAIDDLTGSSRAVP